MNMVLVLTIITVVAGSALAYVNHVTSTQIEQIKAKNLADGIKRVMGVASTDSLNYTTEEAGEFTLYKSEKGIAVQSVENGFGGALKVLVGFDSQGTILGYTILEHAETPGLGAKANEWFQKGNKGDIIGKNPGKNNLTVSKEGGEIDAITASTITSRAFLKAVMNAYEKIAIDATSAATQQEGGNNE